MEDDKFLNINGENINYIDGSFHVDGHFFYFSLKRTKENQYLTSEWCDFSNQHIVQCHVGIFMCVSLRYSFSNKVIDITGFAF